MDTLHYISGLIRGVKKILLEIKELIEVLVLLVVGVWYLVHLVRVLAQ